MAKIGCGKNEDRCTLVLLVIVSVLLIFVVTTSFTFAWFTSSDYGMSQYAFGGAVVVEVADEHGALSDAEPLVFQYSSQQVLPGSKIIPLVYALYHESSTTAVFRAQLSTSVSGLDEAKNEQLNTWFREVMVQQIDDAWALYEDGWYYFLGSASSPCMVMTQPAMTSGLTAPVYGTTNANYTAPTARTIAGGSTVLGSVYAHNENVNLPFLTKEFRIPFHIDDSYANAAITVTFTVQALQDYLIDEQETNILPTVANAKAVFDTLLP